MRRFGTVRVQSRDCVLLTLLCLVLYVPGLTTIPPVDRDEARFAQATKQMLQTSDFVLPHFGSENRFNKPIGIYWLQAAAVLITAGRESAASAAVVAVTGMRLGWRQRLLPASAVAVIGSVVLFVPILQWVVPDLGAVWLSSAASAAVARHGARPLAAVGYHEPSLVFLAATDVALLEPRDAAGFLRDRAGGLVLVSDDQRAAFARAAMDIGLSVREVWAVDGIHYSKGRRTRLALYEQAPPSTGSAMSSE